MAIIRKSNTVSWIWVMPFLLLATALAARSLNADTVWSDEFYMISDARVSLSLPFIAINLAETNPWHVPGYFYLLNFWARVLGWEWHPYMMRVPALLMGVLSIAMTYRFGRDYFSHRVGLFAAVIMSVSAMLSYFMHEIRMYSTNVFLTVFVLWLYWHIVTHSRKLSWWHYAALLLTFVICLYTHYFLAVVLGAIGLYHLIFVRKTWRWLIVSGIGMVAIGAFSPWLNTLLKVADRMSSGTRLTNLTTLELSMLIGNLFSHNLLLFWLVLIALAAIPLFTQNTQRDYVRGLWFITVVAFGAVLLVNAILGVIPEDRARYLILIWPLLATLTALGMTQISDLTQMFANMRPNASIGVLIIWGIMGIHSIFTPHFASFFPSAQMAYPLHKAMPEFESLHRPGDFVLHILPDDVRYQWYRLVLPLYLEHNLALDASVLSPSQHNRPNEDEIIKAIGQEYGREYIWLAYANELSEITRQYLHAIQTRIEAETPYHACENVLSADEVQIDQLVPADVCCYPETRSQYNPPVAYDGLSMGGIEFDLNAESDTLSVWVAWENNDQLPRDVYSYGLPILDADGQLVTTMDSPMPSAPYTCQNRQIDLSDLTAGTYQLHTVVYDRNTGKRLMGTPVTSSQPTDLPRVLRFTIESDGTAILE